MPRWSNLRRVKRGKRLEIANPRRLGALILAGIALSALVIVVAAGRASAGMSVAAVSLGTWDARAKIKAAELSAAQTLVPGPGDRSVPRANARSIAREVLERDLLLPQAWRIIGQMELAGGKAAEKVYPYFAAADTVSRRDLATQIWLADYLIRHEQLLEGFRHFDLAMRQSTQVRGLVMPAFVQGVSDPGIRKPLLDALAAGVPWRSDFILELGRTPAPEASIVDFLRALPDSVVREEAENLRLVAANHVQRGLYRSAKIITERFGEGEVLIRNPAFENPNTSPPFDWELQAGSTHEAVQGDYAQNIEGNGALFLRVSAQARAQLARQILFLSPGQYDVSALTGPDAGPGLRGFELALSCAGPNGQLGERLGTLKLGVTEDRRRYSAKFTIPAGKCEAQWLTVSGAGGNGTDEGSAWLDAIRLAPTGQGPATGGVAR